MLKTNRRHFIAGLLATAAAPALPIAAPRPIVAFDMGTTGGFAVGGPVAFKPMIAGVYRYSINAPGQFEMGTAMFKDGVMQRHQVTHGR